MAYMQQIALRLEMATFQLKRPLSLDEFMGIAGSEKYNSSIITRENLEVVRTAALACCRRNESRIQAIAIVFDELFPHRGRLAFHHFEVDVLAFQLMLRILEPHRIDQQGYGLCGPAAFAINLARTQPRPYARMATDLILKGRSQLGSLELIPNSTVLDYDPKHQLAAIDWVVLGSVANEENILAKETKNELGEYGGSDAAKMCLWLRQAGFQTVMAMHVKYSDSTYGAKMVMDRSKTSTKMYMLTFLAPLIVSFENTYWPRKPSFLDSIEEEWRGEHNLRIAAKLVKQGWRVFMFITESIANPVTFNGLKEQREIYLKMYSGEPNPSMNEEQLELWNKNKAYWMRTEQEIMDEIVSARMIEAKFSNHWGLATEINIEEADEPRVSVVIYSYGQRSVLPSVKFPVFLNCYSGFVACNVRDLTYLESQWRGHELGYETIH